jgi:hypothetical protein
MIGKGDITAQVRKTLKAHEEETHLFLGYRVVGTGLYHFLVPLNQEGIVFTCFPIQAPA